MNKLLTNTVIYTFGNILPQALNILLLPLYTRFMTPSEYGIVQSVTVLTTIFTIIFSLGMERSIYRLYYDFKNENNKKKYLGTLFISLSVTTGVGVFVSVFLREYLSLIYKDINFYPYYVYAIAISSLSIFQLIPKIYLQVKEKARTFFFVSILQMLAQTLFTIWQVILLKNGAKGMLKGLVISNGILLPIFLYMQVKISAFSFEKHILQSSLKFSLPFIPGLISAWVINMADRIFIERYFSLNEVGIYSLAFKINSILILLTGGFFTAYNPHFYRVVALNEQHSAKRKIFKINTIFLIGIIFIGFSMIYFSKEIVIGLFDKRYEEAYKILQILSLSTIISQATGLFNLQLYQEKKTLQPTFIIIMGAILTIIINRIITSQYGMYGAAVTQVVTSFFIFTGIYFMSKKIGFFIPANWKQIIPILITFLFIFIIIRFFDETSHIAIIIKTVTFLIFILFYLKKFKKNIIKLINNP